MCYAYKPVYGQDGTVYKVPHREFQIMARDGLIVVEDDGYHYAKDTVGVIAHRGGEIVAIPMRWDLIPRDFLKNENLALAEVIRKKNSRARNPATGKAWGFSSFNARSETVNTLWSFKRSWNGGYRCVLPVASFKERPNMEGAPKEFQGNEYELFLDRTYYLAGIYDTWESKSGETLDSCTVLTASSAGHSLLESIWHERIPVLLTEEQVEQWLDPGTSPAKAMQMCLKLDPSKMRAERLERKPSPEKPRNPSLLDGLTEG
jgi:putative SOS response-associated peptidase YedK